MQKKTRKYLLNTAMPAPSTGEMLTGYISKNRIYQSALCRALNRHTSAIAAFRKRPTMQTAVLWEICHALQHNFFADIAAQLPDSYSHSAAKITSNEQPEVAALQAAILALTIERDTLQKMLEKCMEIGKK